MLRNKCITMIQHLHGIRYMCKLALGSRNDENSVLTFFQTIIYMVF